MNETEFPQSSLLILPNVRDILSLLSSNAGSIDTIHSRYNDDDDDDYDDDDDDDDHYHHLRSSLARYKQHQ